MNRELLEEIGLTKSEINVYLALLELGSSTTGKIVEKSKASSSKIYEILDKLIEKGLVSYIVESGVKHFEAASPERIMDYMEEKEEKVSKQKQELKKLIPELELKKTLSKYKSEATIFKGIKGGETAFRYLINSMTKKDEWLGFVVSFTNRRYFNLLTKLHVWRAKKGLKSRIIFSEGSKEDGKVREKIPHTKVKYVPEELQTPAIVNVAGNITLLNIMAEEVTVFMIENKEVADSFRNQFEKLWNQDTTISKGMKALGKAFNQMLDEKEPGETWDVLGGAFGVKGQEKQYIEFFKKFTKKRLQKGVPIRLLLQQGTKAIVSKYGKEIYKKNDQLKFLPYKTEFPVVIIPSKEKTLLMIQKEDPTIIMISNKEVSQAFQKHFEARWEQDVRVYKGFKAVTDKFTSMLDLYKEGEEYYVLGATYGLGGKKLKDWFMDYSKRRMTKKVTGKFLVVPEDRERIIYEFTHTGDPEMKYSVVKDLPPDFSTPMQINLYKGNRVLMFLWGKEMMCFEIESEILYKNFKTYFDTLWEQETRIIRGEEGPKMVLKDILEAGKKGLPNCGFGTNEDDYEKYFPAQLKEFIQESEKYKIKGRLIFAEGFTPPNFTAEVRHLPPEYFSPVRTMIYGNKVAIVDFTKPITTIIIEKKEIADSYRNHFDVLWKIAKFERENKIKKFKEIKV